MQKDAVDNVVVKVFNGYGHQHSLILYGQVKKGPRKKERTYTFNVLRNIYSIAKLYFIRPIPFAKVRMLWNHQVIEGATDDEGFFKLEWSSVGSTPGGWWPVRVYAVGESGNEIGFGDGKIFVPHITQYGIISDIDDTVLVSHSASTGKKLTTLLTIDPLKRKTFSDVVHFYQLLSLSGTAPDVPNPFFYVSNSEWNLYDYLADFFTQNKLPEGIFLLSDFKRFAEMLRIGNTRHRSKGDRMRRILDVFPNQRFILVGDNSQKDPVIYSEIANEHPFRIEAIFIRVVNAGKRSITISLLESIRNKKIHVHLFEDTSEAIAHAMKVGLIAK
jgi:phosphatidate phosphatase APP1